MGDERGGVRGEARAGRASRRQAAWCGVLWRGGPHAAVIQAANVFARAHHVHAALSEERAGCAQQEESSLPASGHLDARWAAERC